MAGQHLEAIDSIVQKTHEWLGAIAEASHFSKAFGSPFNLSPRFQPGTTIGERDPARLSTLSPNTRTSSSRASVYFASARHQHAVLVAGHVLAKLAVAAIPVVVIVAVSVATVAAFVGGYLAALR
jgi:hypothetical protein